MIIFRYLAREVLLTMVAVSGVLLLVIMSGRFVKYLADAAAGKLSADVLFSIMAYRLPGFLELVLPLGFFIAILLAYGRLYMDHEMTVLSACGMSRRRLLAYTLVPALLVAALVGSLSLWLSPYGVQRSEAIFDAQEKRSEIDSLSPATFQASAGGQSITYAESLSEDRQHMYKVFMAEMGRVAEDEELEISDDEVGGLALIVAESGQQVVDPVSGQRYLQLNQGYRYEGQPGRNDYRIIQFDTYAQLLVSKTSGKRPPEADSKTTLELLRVAPPEGEVAWRWKLYREDLAALQWRFSLPVLVLVVALMAVPLSHTNPRQGRYMKMIPAILLYVVYLVSLSAARGAIEDGKLPVSVGLWLVHAGFLIIAIGLLGWGYWRQWLRQQLGSQPTEVGGERA